MRNKHFLLTITGQPDTGFFG